MNLKGLAFSSLANPHRFSSGQCRSAGLRSLAAGPGRTATLIPLVATVGTPPLVGRSDELDRLWMDSEITQAKTPC